jgi:hypothetical protein
MADLFPNRPGAEFEFTKMQIEFAKGWKSVSEDPLPAEDIIYFCLLKLDRVDDAYNAGVDLALRSY